MKNLRVFILVALACGFAATAALAHAFLDHAVPGVGATVQSAPSEIELSFTQEITAAFSGASVASAEGGAVPTGKATVNAASPNILHVPLGQKLKPGVYVVNWHAVSLDTHRSTGSYKFTVAP
jgi:methionine-rich copper-binding protein CopC